MRVQVCADARTGACNVAEAAGRREKRRREEEREPDTSDYTCFELETL